jgi:hypothetical protein
MRLDLLGKRLYELEFRIWILFGFGISGLFSSETNYFKLSRQESTLTLPWVP